MCVYEYEKYFDSTLFLSHLLTATQKCAHKHKASVHIYITNMETFANADTYTHTDTRMNPIVNKAAVCEFLTCVHTICR